MRTYYICRFSAQAVGLFGVERSMCGAPRGWEHTREGILRLRFAPLRMTVFRALLQSVRNNRSRGGASSVHNDRSRGGASNIEERPLTALCYSPKGKPYRKSCARKVLPPGGLPRRGERGVSDRPFQIYSLIVRIAQTANDRRPAMVHRSFAVARLFPSLPRVRAQTGSSGRKTEGIFLRKLTFRFVFNKL